MNFRSQSLYVSWILLLVMLVLLMTTSSAQLLDPIFVLGVEWSPNGTKIGAVGMQGFAQLIDLLTKDVLHDISRTSPEPLYAIAWSPDNRRIAIAGQGTSIDVWSVDDGKLLITLTDAQETVLDTTAILDLDWSPDGHFLTSITQDYRNSPAIWDMNSYELGSMAYLGDKYSVAHHPQLPEIAFGGINGLTISSYDLEITNQDQNRFRWLKDHQIKAVAWNSDGSQVAGVDDTGIIHILDHLTKTTLNTIKIGNTPSYTIAWSPDDQYIASYTTSGQIQLWEVANGELVTTYNGNLDKLAFSIGFSPYGGRLAYGGQVTWANGRTQNDQRIQIVVPAPSLERLHAVADLCTRKVSVSMSAQDLLKTNTVTTLTVDDLPNFITQIERLPTDAIPPACAADLIAVAEAIIAQP